MSNYRRARVPGGSYFFTLVAHDRRPVLTNEDVRVALRAAVQAVRTDHPFYVEAWVLLPDHLHCLWRLPEDDADYALRWAKIKRFTRHHLGMSAGEKLWQSRYWEQMGIPLTHVAPVIRKYLGVRYGTSRAATIRLPGSRPGFAMRT